MLGTVAGITAADAVDADDENKPLLAVALKVYAVPFVKPVTTHEVAPPVAVQGVPTALFEES